MISSINLLITAGLLSSANSYDLAVDNVRIYQPEKGSYSSPTRIYVDDGRIVDIENIAEPLKKAEKVIDANNQFATPGLTDLHVHLSASGSNYSNFQHVPVTSHLNSNLHLGITQIVDLFASEELINQTIKLAANEHTPTFFYAGLLFTNKGGHGTQFGSDALVVVDDSDIPALWEKHMSLKPSVTKAVIESFGGHGSTLTDSQLKAIGIRSKAAGLPYFIHVSTLADGKRAIRAGATALAHGIANEAIDQEFIALMKKHDVAYIPTLAVMQNHHREKHDQAVSGQPELLATVPKKLQHCLFSKVPTPSKWLEELWQQRDHAFNNVKRLQQAGIKIGTGSDAGNPYTLHGAGLHHELALLAEAGMTNQQIINASTMTSADIINQSNTLGQISIGYEASFIITKQSPITDIRHLADIEYLVKSGEIINRGTLVDKNRDIPVTGQSCDVAVQPSQLANEIIDDFSSDLQWQSISDSMMGGSSNATVKIGNKQMKVATQLGEVTSFGAWAGAQLTFELPKDASRFKGIQIKYQSSKASIGMSVYHQEVTDWDHFSTTLTPSSTWKTVQIPFSELKQFGFGNKVQWQADKIVGLSFVWRNFANGNNVEDTSYINLDNVSFY